MLTAASVDTATALLVSPTPEKGDSSVDTSVFASMSGFADLLDALTPLAPSCPPPSPAFVESLPVLKPVAPTKLEAILWGFTEQLQASPTVQLDAPLSEIEEPELDQDTEPTDFAAEPTTPTQTAPEVVEPAFVFWAPLTPAVPPLVLRSPPDRSSTEATPAPALPTLAPAAAASLQGHTLPLPPPLNEAPALPKTSARPRDVADTLSPRSAPMPTVVAPVVPAASVAPQVAAPVVTPAAPDTAPVAPALPKPAALAAAPAQISAPTVSSFDGKDNYGESKNKNRSQPIESKLDTTLVTDGGTARAYEQLSMSSSPASFAPTVSPTRSADAPAVSAVRLVERVAEVAAHLAARPNEPVSLSIQLDDTHHVDVRVSMRAGQIHTAFRSDSPEVRQALATAWEGFVKSRDAIEQSWAEPVFASIGSASPVTSSIAPVLMTSEARGESNLLGSGQDAPRQHTPDRRAELFSMTHSRGSMLAAPVVPVSSPDHSRPDTSLHLSVLA
jgi:hypothetical protein